MLPGRRLCVVLLAPLVALGGCSSFREGGAMPMGLDCTNLVSAGADGGSLAAALGSAPPGTCVLLEQGTYDGAFSVPAGVTIASPQGVRGILRGGTATTPTVSLTGAAGSGLSHLDVQVMGGIGVAIDGGPVLISDVTVSGANGAAATASCSTPCTASSAITFSGVDLGASLVGLAVNGAYVEWNGGAIHDNVTMNQLAGGVGAVATGGATLQLSGVTVANNAAVGVLIDGAGHTTASLTNVTVSGNLGRGIWAQNLSGTVDAPALTITQSTVTQNKIVGVGVFASGGVVITGGSIDSTIDGPEPTGVNEVDQVGDGLQLLAQTRDVSIDSVAIANNARAAGLVDAAGTGIHVVSSQVMPGASNLLFVIQRSTQPVDVPPASTSQVTMPLPVASGALPVFMP